MSVSDLLLRRAGVNGAPKSLPIAVKKMGRRDLPVFTRDLGFTRGAEIGVWKGEFSAKFCEVNAGLHMLCVDPWQSYPAWLDTKNAMLQPEAAAFIGDAYRLALARLASLNCTIVRQFSAEAAADVADRSLDFVYIDGNHVRDAVLEDLAVWAPKVRVGGFLAGHDFRVFENKPTIQVIEAVSEYTKTHAIDPWFVLSAEPTPSFLWEVR